MRSNNGWQDSGRKVRCNSPVLPFVTPLHPAKEKKIRRLPSLASNVFKYLPGLPSDRPSLLKTTSHEGLNAGGFRSHLTELRNSIPLPLNESLDVLCLVCGFLL